MQQINRLEVLKQGLEQTNQRAEAARDAHETLQKLLLAQAEADRNARALRRDADRAVADAGRALSRAEADRNLAESRLDSLGLAVARHEEEAIEGRRLVTEAENALAALDDVSSARADVEMLRQTVEGARIAMMTRRSALDELRREGTARERRAQDVAKELGGWRNRLDTAGKRSAELLERKEASERELTEASSAPGEIAAKREELTGAISAAETRTQAASAELSTGEADLRDTTLAERDAERLASEAREARARAEARADAAKETVNLAAERIDEERDTTPEALAETLEINADEMSDVEVLENQLSRLKGQREALGAVNLRAEEDAKEVQAEHDTLVGEKADLTEAIRTLRSGIASLNKEGRERLLTAFEEVNSNFSMLFKHLFNGGEANLVMVESDDPLEAGLEIMCQPPGKKLSTLSLLSGGEQTLTAMALIFAVFLANPAPICVLDEVDAPLDDANVTRFCDLLDEMCRQTDTRFLIITHHAVTMARMDRLFGVTMAEQGVSQLVSVDLKKAETLVA